MHERHAQLSRGNNQKTTAPTVLVSVQAADPRVELRYGDAAKTGLPDGSASLVSLSLVVHELAGHARREVGAAGSLSR